MNNKFDKKDTSTAVAMQKQTSLGLLFAANHWGLWRGCDSQKARVRV